MSGSGTGVGQVDYEPDDDATFEDEPQEWAAFDWTPAENDTVYSGPPAESPDDITAEQPDFSGGANVVPHGSFETSTGWTVGAAWTVPYTPPSYSAWHGTSVARGLAEGVASSIGITEYIAVDITYPYAISVMSLMNDWTSGEGRLVLVEYDASGEVLRETVLGTASGISSSWQRIERVVVARSTRFDDVIWHPETVMVRLYADFAGTPIFDWYIDGLTMTQGDTPVSFSPRPGEDISGGEIIDGSLPASKFDTTPPDAPTGLALVSTVLAGQDGTMGPAIGASWDANTEDDLDAYEVQVDRAVVTVPEFEVSASGTGGSLTAGTYNIVVTGTTAHGETARAADSIAVASGEHLYVTITPLRNMTGYNIYASRDDDPLFALDTAVTGSPVEVASEGTGGPAPTDSTAVPFVTPTVYRTAGISLTIHNVIGGAYYAARIRAVDFTGNYSAWSTIVPIMVAGDTVAPSVPGALSVSPGYRLLGLRWDAVEDVDLARYEVRYTPDDGLGEPTDEWVTITTDTNWVVITGLDGGLPDGTPGTEYHVQVRSIDYSGNASAWCNSTTGDYITGTPNLIGGADVAYGSIVAQHIAASGIEAGLITSGTLHIGGYLNAPDYLIVYDAEGDEIGRWDADGLLITDPDDSDNQVRIQNGIMSFSNDGGVTWGTAISGTGIVADAITTGIAPGGHNSVPNSSFELVEYGVTLSNEWEADQAWATTIGTDVNTTKNTADIRLTTYTY